MKKKRIIIVGAFNEIIELCEENKTEIVACIDKGKVGDCLNYKIIGTDIEATNILNPQENIPLLITPDNPRAREKLYSYYHYYGFKFLTLLSKKANISKRAKIDIGTIVQSGVNVSTDCKIGKFVKLNTNCNIMHNSTIDDFTTVAPNAVILGYVKIGKFCYIGSNATILPNIEICDGATIGAGSVVTKNIIEPSIFIGNPAVKKN